MSIKKASSVTNILDHLPGKIYAQIKADIFDFRFLPGDKFSEGDIASRMGVSRTPVRQALFRLQQEGYVDVLFKSGWQVRPFDFKFFEDLYELRVVLESSSINKIVSEGLFDRITCLNAIWCVPVEKQLTDQHAVTLLDEQFHRTLVQAVDNTEIARIHHQLTEKIRIIRRLDFTKPLRIDATYREHAAILRCIFAQDTASAIHLIQSHIAESQAEVKRITIQMLQTARDKYNTRDAV